MLADAASAWVCRRWNLVAARSLAEAATCRPSLKPCIAEARHVGADRKRPNAADALEPAAVVVLPVPEDDSRSRSGTCWSSCWSCASSLRSRVRIAASSTGRETRRNLEERA